MVNKEEKEIKALEEDLVELELYINQMWNFIPVPVILVNPLNNILSISSKFKEFSGYEDDIIGASLDQIFPEKGFLKKLLTRLEKEKGRINRREIIFFNQNRKGNSSKFFSYAEKR